MKKSLLIILFAATSFWANAQMNSEQKKIVFARVDSLVLNYIKYSSFLVSGQNNVNAAAVDRFRRLFNPDAKLPDEMMISYFLGDSVNKDRINTVNLSEFLTHIQSNYPSGLTIKLLNSDVDYSDVDKGNIMVVLHKITEGFNSNGFNLQNQGVFVLHIKMSKDLSKVYISSIEPLEQTAVVLNDRDHDYVIDSKDECPSTFGLAYLDGCPKKGVTLPHVWGTAGFFVGKANGDITEGSASGASGFISPYSFDKGTIAGGYFQLEYYFGAKANFGIGAGVAFSSTNGTISKDSLHLELAATDKFGKPYRQLISARGPIEEEVSISSLSIPILLIYKGDVSKKLGFRIEGGILYNLSYKPGFKSSNGKFDYEAIYRYDNSGNAQTVTGTPTINDWLITSAHTIKSTSDVSAYFNSMRGYGYPVGLGLTTSNGLKTNTSADYEGGIGVLIRPSIVLKLGQKTGLNLGLFYMNNSFTNQKVTLAVDANQNYNGMYNNFSKVSHSSFGLNISLSHSLF